MGVQLEAGTKASMVANLSGSFVRQGADSSGRSVPKKSPSLLPVPQTLHPPERLLDEGAAQTQEFRLRRHIYQSENTGLINWL